MKIRLVSAFLATFFITSVFAGSDLKRNEVRTVEDVKEYRAKVIDKMTKRLNSGELNSKQAKFLGKRIALLSSKPLPSQEQINWRLKNRSDIESMNRKGKNLKKGKRKQLREKRHRTRFH